MPAVTPTLSFTNDAPYINTHNLGSIPVTLITGVLVQRALEDGESTVSSSTPTTQFAQSSTSTTHTASETETPGKGSAEVDGHVYQEGEDGMSPGLKLVYAVMGFGFVGLMAILLFRNYRRRRRTRIVHLHTHSHTERTRTNRRTWDDSGSIVSGPEDAHVREHHRMSYMAGSGEEGRGRGVTRGADIDAGGRRAGGRDPDEVGLDGVADKDDLPAYDAVGGPPRYDPADAMNEDGAGNSDLGGPASAGGRGRFWGARIVMNGVSMTFVSLNQPGMSRRREEGVSDGYEHEYYARWGRMWRP